MSELRNFTCEELFANTCAKVCKPKTTELKVATNSRPQSVNFNFIAAILSGENSLVASGRYNL